MSMPHRVERIVVADETDFLSPWSSWCRAFDLMLVRSGDEADELKQRFPARFELAIESLVGSLSDGGVLEDCSWSSPDTVSLTTADHRSYE
jgi:hypothetical protein